MSFKVMSQLADIDIGWYPVAGTNTLYVGQLVYSTADGLNTVGAASGAADTTSKTPPWGVIVGVNDDAPVYDTTNKVNKIVGVETQAAQVARTFIGVEGMWSKNDPQAFVKVARIRPGTILQANIYNAAVGTAPTLLTVTTGSTDGLSFTSNACDFTPVDQFAVAYCRSGANAGLYRHTSDTSTTACTVLKAFPQDIAIGDTFVRVPGRTHGQAYAQTDTSSLYFNCAVSPATDYWVIDVDSIDLSAAGKETVTFAFNVDHFGLKRA